MITFDKGLDLFISEFHLDKNRPKGQRRTKWKVTRINGGGMDVHQAEFFIDGEIVSTHIYNNAEALWLREFLEEKVYDYLGIMPAGWEDADVSEEAKASNEER